MLRGGRNPLRRHRRYGSESARPFAAQTPSWRSSAALSHGANHASKTGGVKDFPYSTGIEAVSVKNGERAMGPSRSSRGEGSPYLVASRPLLHAGEGERRATKLRYSASRPRARPAAASRPFGSARLKCCRAFG